MVSTVAYKGQKFTSVRIGAIFWKPLHKPPQKFENRAMRAFWEICISVPWVVTLLSGAASFIFANRINVMFLTGEQGNTMQNKHCTEMRDEKWEMRNERGMLYIYKKNIWLFDRGGHISVKRSDMPIAQMMPLLSFLVFYSSLPCIVTWLPMKSYLDS